MKADSLPPDPRMRNLALAAFAIIAAILTTLGLLYYQSEKGEITRKQYQTLAAIGELKARQIQRWRKERLAEVERASKDALTRKTISDVLADPTNQSVQKKLQECLRDELTGQDNSAALLFDVKGNLLASTDDSVGPVDAATREAMSDAIAGNKSVASDFYCNPEGIIHIDFAAPVPDDNGRPEAVLILRHEARSYLYPLLQEWPTPSRSAETYLVWRDGNEVVFLTDVRHRGGTALSLRHPLTETRLPAVQAVLGKQGIFEGNDYRGVDVVSAILPVTDSPWFIVAKMDAEEILANAGYRAGVIGLIVGLLILLAGSLVALFYRQRQAGILNSLVKAERQKAEAQERELKLGKLHRAVLRTAMDGFWVVDVQGRILEVNEAVCRMTGYSEQELLTMSIPDLEAVETRDETAAHTNKIIAQSQDRFESRHRRKDGTIIDVEVSVHSSPADGIIAAFIRDITERKESEEALRASDKRFSQLFKSMEEGFFLAELIFDPAGKPVDWRFLDVNPAYSKIMGIRREDVIGRSVRELFPGLEDFWFKAHTRCALTGEPATLDGFVQAAGRYYINHLHSPCRGQFACIFTDITEQKMAELTLRASEEQFRAMFEMASIGMAQADPRTGRWLRVNQKMCGITGYTPDEMLKLQVRDITHPDDRQKDVEDFERVVRGEVPSYRREKRYVRKDGTEVWVNVNMTALRNADGTLVRTMATIEDITGRKAAEETANRLAAIVTSSDDAIIGMDLDGAVTSWNHGAGKMFGYTAAEMVGKSIQRLRPASRHQEKAEILANIKAGTGIEHLETERRCKDGRLLNVSITFSPIKDADGTVIGVSKVARDITARKQAEVCRRIGAEILHGLLQSDDLQSSVRHIVSSLKQGTGFEAVGIRLEDGEDFPYAFQEGFSEDFLRTENSLAARAPGGGLCRDKNGKVCLECTCGLVIAGKTDPANPLFTHGGSCWTNDSLSPPGIPAEKDARLHPRNQCIHHGYASVALIPIRTQGRIIGLIQLNDRRKGCFTLETIEILEGIASYIGEALMRRKFEQERNEALLRAEASAAAKSEFLGVMSHELRTPLNGVLGFSELLFDTPLDDEQKSYAQTIRRSGEHLLAIVNDVLDFSSIENGALSIHVAPLAIADLVKSSEQAVGKAATDKGLRFRSVIGAGVPEKIYGDELRMRQILINLLGNAIKFTSNGSVNLRVSTVKEADGQFLDFSVDDTGIGMSPGTIGILFHPFTQAEMKRNRTFGGTGLGLAISKRLAEAMGGKITVVSTENKGSTFTFRLPLAASAAPEPGALSPGVPPQLASTEEMVLVVDDDAASGVVAVKMLQNLGYRADFVGNGAEAVATFVPGKYSAILMDIAMPVMDGLAATRKIREIEGPTGHYVPIIAFTANVMPGDRERCLAASMDDFLAKPFKKDELAAKLAVNKHASKPNAGPRMNT